MAFFIVYKGHKEHYWKCEKSLLFVIKLTETENTKKQRGRKKQHKSCCCPQTPRQDNLPNISVSESTLTVKWHTVVNEVVSSAAESKYNTETGLST